MNKEKSQTNSEFFVHSERKNGTRDLYFGNIGDSQHGHAVIGKNGNIKYLRESDESVKTNDRI